MPSWRASTGDVPISTERDGIDALPGGDGGSAVVARSGGRPAANWLLAVFSAVLVSWWGISFVARLRDPALVAWRPWRRWP